MLSRGHGEIYRLWSGTESDTWQSRGLGNPVCVHMMGLRVWPGVSMRNTGLGDAVSVQNTGQVGAREQARAG